MPADHPGPSTAHGELANVVLPLMTDAVCDVLPLSRADAREVVRAIYDRLTAGGYAMVKVVI